MAKLLTYPAIPEPLKLVAGIEIATCELIDGRRYKVLLPVIPEGVLMDTENTGGFHR